ncbi:undecaprenyl-diphosphatase [Cytobacillus sp. FJAT-53684]|uniref:Undecaprenyl-diphosphatase n=1 Tax=Cytobacillus mangrovibacter TaxID=3299024 RepID=A0ABW6K2P6_9BACI
MAFSETNIDVFRMVNDLGKEYTYLNPPFVFIAEYTVYLLALATIIYWFTRGRNNRMMVISAVLTFMIAEILGKLAGTFHSNYQPFVELTNVNQLIEKTVGNSFPSDHTILFFSFCMTFWLFKRGYGLLWMIAAILVGISRMWVGVHYPADVAVGALISIISAIAVYYVVPRISFIQKLLKLYEKGEGYILPSKTKSKDL